MKLTKITSVLMIIALTFQPNIASAGWKEEIKKGWKATCQKTESTWDKVCTKTKEVSKDAIEWSSDHKKEIVTGTVVTVIVVGGIVLYCCTGDDSQLDRPYTDLPDPPSATSGEYFSPTQKAKILEENMRRNDGELRSDLSGVLLSEPKQHLPGYSPPANEAHIDHIIPRSKGGPNSYDNAQVLSRKENLSKGDKTE